MAEDGAAGNKKVRLAVTLLVPTIVALVILFLPLKAMVLRALVTHGGSGTVQSALQSPDYRTRLAAITALGKLSDPLDVTAPLWVQAIGDADDEVSKAAQAAATARGVKPDDLGPACGKLIEGQDPAVRLYAARALAVSAPTHPRAVGVWLRALNDSETKVRQQAVHALAKLTGESATPDSLKALIAGLTNPKYYVRKMSAVTVGQLGPAGGPAAAPLVDLAVRDKEVRRFALKSLLKLGPAAAKPLVDAWVKQKGELVGDLGDVLGNIEPKQRGVLPQVEPFVTSSDQVRRHSAATLLATIDPPRALTVFTSLIEHADPAVRGEVIGQLGVYGPAAAGTVPAIIKHLDDSDKNVRLTCIGALAGIGPAASAAKPRLEKFLKDPEEMVRKAAEGAIASITAKP